MNGSRMRTWGCRVGVMFALAIGFAAAVASARQEQPPEGARKIRYLFRSGAEGGQKLVREDGLPAKQDLAAAEFGEMDCSAETMDPGQRSAAKAAPMRAEPKGPSEGDCGELPAGPKEDIAALVEARRSRPAPDRGDGGAAAAGPKYLEKQCSLCEGREDAGKAGLDESRFLPGDGPVLEGPGDAKAYPYFYDAWWENEVDGDGDGYTSTRRLCVDIDVTEGASASVYIAIYYRREGTSTWYLDYSSSCWTFTGTAVDSLCISPIGSGPEYPHARYEFSIDLYWCGGAYADTIDYTWDGDLNYQAFETAAEDQVVAYIFGAWWEESVDWDEPDGYTRRRDFCLDVDVAGGSASVYYKLWYRLEGTTTWNLYYTTGCFTRTGYTADSYCILDVGSGTTLPHGAYEWAVDL
ncbi:MAG: choice-of-anchor H family protein, partial [Lentisphaeria bacterium]|nr:choice-of-anchor H family protein [Lentisphaeria bacterium]